MRASRYDGKSAYDETIFPLTFDDWARVTANPSVIQSEKRCRQSSMIGSSEKARLFDYSRWKYCHQDRHLTSGPKRSHLPFFRATVRATCRNAVSSIESRSFRSVDLAASLIRFKSSMIFVSLSLSVGSGLDVCSHHSRPPLSHDRVTRKESSGGGCLANLKKPEFLMFSGSEE